MQSTHPTTHAQAFASTLLEYILANIKRRFDLAFLWLYTEYILALEQEQAGTDPESGSDRVFERYDHFLIQILDGANRVLSPQDKMFLRLVLEVPRVCVQAFLQEWDVPSYVH